MNLRIIALTLTVLLLAGCVQTPISPVTTAVSGTEASSDTSAATKATEPADDPIETTGIPETAEVTETPTETAEVTEAPTETTAETEPAHCALFIPYVSADDMVQFFNEVCLDAEFINGGDASKLQRWDQPIYYSINGDPTDADRQVLETLTQWLNTVEGFPGISEAEEPWQTNMAIYFCDQPELIDRMGDQYWGTDGAFTFWYDDQDVIYDCTICIRTDLDQEVRNSVILEEIYNALGPAQDTDLRVESIIYSGYSIPQALHPIDQVILRLLYHPSLTCGMTAADCEAVIRELYY